MCIKKWYTAAKFTNFHANSKTFIELKDLYATYTDFENASWCWPTNNFKREKNAKMAISPF
jgi:hypothetical protein